jgi:anti-sigma-K factor RskA
VTSDKDHLTGSYALNGLDPDERAAFEQHLATSPETRDEVTELTDTAVLLGLAVEPVIPSASLKASIMAQLDSHPQIQDAPAPLLTDRAQRRWFTRPVVAIAAVAAAVALIAGGGVLVTSLGGTDTGQSQADQLAAINAADDAQRVSVDAGGGATATLVWSNSLLSSAVIMDGMAPAPAGTVYQLWYINEDGARSGGTITVPGDGRAWRVLDGEMVAGDIVGVTVEPAGGSEAPTSDPIVTIASA